jgi:hypothetical protein
MLSSAPDAGLPAVPAEWEPVARRARLEVEHEPAVIVGEGLPAAFGSLARSTAGAPSRAIVHATGFGPRGEITHEGSATAEELVAVCVTIAGLGTSAGSIARIGTKLIACEGVLEWTADGWVVREVAAGRSAADLQELVPFTLFADASLAPMP